MDTNKIKVYNPTSFNVGVVTLDRPLGFNIRPGSFVLMTEDDVAYVSSICTLFQRGMLRVDEQHEDVMMSIGIDMNTDPNFISNEEIGKKLAGTPKKLQEWLETVNEPHVLDRVYEVAKASNLTANRLKILQEKMPDRDFMQ